jgi:hypothetical protein
MQNTPTFVAQSFAQMAEPAVRLVNQDQGIRIRHNAAAIGTVYRYWFIHTTPRHASLAAHGVGMIAACETQAPAALAAEPTSGPWRLAIQIVPANLSEYI